MATLALNVDPSGVERGTSRAKRALDGVKGSAAGAEAAVEGVATANARASSSTTSFAGAQARAKASVDQFTQSTKFQQTQLRFLPVQLSQTIQQLIAGQPAYQIAIQQGNDINQALGGQGLRGTLRALGGAFASIINPISLATIGIIAGGGALLQWAFSADDAQQETRTLEDVVNDLASTTADYTRATQEASQPTKDLQEQYGNLADQARLLLEAQAELSREQSLREFGAAVSAVNEEIPNFAANINLATQRSREFFEGINETLLERLAERLGLTTEQARLLQTEFIGLSQAQTIEGQAKAADLLRQRLIEVTGGVQNVSNESFQLLQRLRDISQSGLDIVAATDGISPSLAQATSQANDLAGAISNAASAALDLASNSAGALEAERLRLQFRNQPVQLAGALAAQRFDQTAPDLTNAPDGFRRELEQARDLTITNQVETARLREERRLLSEQDRNAERAANLARRASSRSSNSTSRRAQRDAERLQLTRQRNQERIDGLRQEISILGQEGDARRSNLVVLNEYRAVQSAISSLGPTATQAEIEAVRTLTIERRNLLESTREQQSIAREQEQLVEGFSSTFSNAFSQSLRDGENAWRSFGDAGRAVLNSLIDQLQNQLISSIFQAVLGLGGLGGGGGFLGGIFGFANGGAFNGSGNVTPFARGGIVNSPTPFSFNGGRLGVAGEAGPEAIIPLKRGPDGSLGVQAQPSRQEVVVRVDTNDERFNTYVDNRAGGQVAPLQDRMDESARTEGRRVQGFTRQQQIRGTRG